MTKKIFRTILAVAICVFLASATIFMAALYEYFSDVRHDSMKTQVELAAQGVLSEGEDYFDGVELEEYRITWIASDGSVIYDSDSNPEEMGNHLKREEVKEAFADGYGESTRYSDTLTKKYLYSAKRLSNGSVLRLALSQSSLFALYFSMLKHIILFVILLAVLSIVLAHRLAKRIVEPINSLDLEHPLDNNKEYEEIEPLLARMDIQQREIRTQKSQLARKQTEFLTLTEGMSEGIVLLDAHGFILSINPAAEDVLSADSSAEGISVLSLGNSHEIEGMLDKSAKGEHVEREVSSRDAVYRFSMNPVMHDDVLQGHVLLILDVTENDKTEKLRREFAANVSHELKTPLHTICGCAELLSCGMVKPDDTAKFSEQIYAEAKRMITLVEDIISLSHLDEGAEDLEREEVDLLRIAEETAAQLQTDAESAEVDFKLEGESVKVFGISRLLSSIVYNLCENAIKYNRRGGNVEVEVRDCGDYAMLSVKDDGIGIPEEDRERIFERFYRVDKSHSKEIGGTGLGLSIVKHAARLHDARIELESAEGVGTCVNVKIPKSM